MKPITVADYLKKTLPAGTYEATVVSAEEKLSRDALSEYVNVTLAVGEARRKVYDRFLTSHTNPDAVAFGLTKLSGLAHAMGLEMVSAAEELLGGKVMVELGTEEDQERGEYNVVKKYMPKASPDEVHGYKEEPDIPF